MKVNLIVAMDRNNGIGINNKIPWHLKQDLLYFKNLTKGAHNNAIIMGKNTFNSIGHCLPFRDNIVLSTTLIKEANNLQICKNIKDLKEYLNTKNYDEIWVIGGSSIYQQFLDNPECIDKIYITEIDQEYECDCFFPNVTNGFELIHTSICYENNIVFHFNIYKNIII